MEVSKEKYVSVIKINGNPILPPLITPDLRKELQKDKHQAVKLEHRLKKCRELKELLESQRPCSDLTFNDDSHVDALEIDKRIHLSKDLIEVCQYNDNGLTVVERGTYTTNSPIGSYRARSASVPRREEIQECSTPKPRLIRSNSYTLDSPSPIVLELMKKSNNDSEDFSSINTVIYKHESPDNSSKDVNDAKSPTIEVYQTDISVQQITVNSNNAQSKKEAFFMKNPFDSLEPDSELLNLLKEIPEEYSSQIIQLLEKQRSEQKDRLERYDNLKSNSEINFKSPPKNDLIDLTSFSEPIITRPHTTESTISKKSTDTLKRSSTFSMSPSQSLYYSMTTEDAHTTSTNLGENGVEPLELGVLRQKNGYWEGILKHDGRNDCSRELFPELDPITIKAAQREWAANLITAHVKGYLTRRLFKTERVQNVISTVKDVLMCALELHHSENIDEKDVELHRRLINQLSAALYMFHEIFFDISIPEQMMIISTDRQRKLEKIKNPPSGRSSVRSKSLSTPRSSSSSKRRIAESPSFTKV